MEGINKLHDDISFYLIIILILVSWILISSLYRFNKNPIRYKYLNHGTTLELIWTITPALILIAIAFPSFKLLYIMDILVIFIIKLLSFRTKVSFHIKILLCP